MQARTLIMAMSFAVAAAVGTTHSIAAEPEPSAQIATQWWPELRHVVTPVGWRDHLHRFHIVYDGTILARPPRKPTRFQGEKDPESEGVQLSFIPSSDATVPKTRGDDDYRLALPDGSQVGRQGWLDEPAPVLWSVLHSADPALTGAVELRHIVFAHMLGGGESQTGFEPMFAWVRLEVARADAAGAGAPKEITCHIKLNHYHLDFEMDERKNGFAHPKKSAYPRALRWEGERIIEEDDRIRLGVLPGGAATQINFTPRIADSRDNILSITLPAKAGAHVDLLLPMIRADRNTFDQEQNLGRDTALAQANAFWSPRPATAATIHTPEPLVNDVLNHNIRFARMISLTIPATRQKTLLSGSMIYSVLWNTPTSMTSHMLLDPLGWHDDVEKYLEIHRTDQGTAKPPGDDFPQHPGYFGVPKPVDIGYQWLTDHGAVLYTASYHALLTGDEKFIAKWLDPIVKGCEFIKDARKLPRKPPQVQGVMPAASASDKKDPIQSFWSDGWNYKGLSTAARLLRQLNHPRAAEFEKEADDYRNAIVAAFRAKAARMPKWKDRAGNEHGIVPMSLNADDSNGYGINHPFYLDTGPMFGVYAGVLPADDPLMRTSVAFLREGPQVPAEFDPFWWDKTPYLFHEMSNCEPCYSWNIFHTHQLGERQRYLEGMYSLFAGACSRQTFITCETRDGITDTVFAAPLAAWMARLAVIDDEIEPENLHLMRLAPLAWISSKEQTRFENLPTTFGPVTLKWQLTDEGRRLNIEFTPHFRRPPKSTTLHVPPLTGVTKVLINSRECPARPGERLTL